MNNSAVAVRRPRKEITPTEAARHNIQVILNRVQGQQGEELDPQLAKAYRGLRELMNALQRQNALIENLTRGWAVGRPDDDAISIACTVREVGGEKELLVDGETFYRVTGRLPGRDDRAPRSMCVLIPDELIPADDGENVCVTVITSAAEGMDTHHTRQNDAGYHHEEE